MFQEFVALVEDEFNDVSVENVNTWLSDFIDTDAGMTPQERNTTFSAKFYISKEHKRFWLEPIL